MALTRDRKGVILRDPPQAPDILYPSGDDEPIAETEPQYYAITEAVFALKMHLRQLGRAATVRGNCALYYDPDNRTTYLPPNVLLAYGVAVPSEEGYVPWVYGQVPDLVMEMASPSTHAQDGSLKWERYATLGIPEYWQYAPHHRYLTEDLLGWQLQDGACVPIPCSSTVRAARGSDGVRGLGVGHDHWYPAVVESGASEMVPDGAGSRDGSHTGRPRSCTSRSGSRTGTGSRVGDRTAPNPAPPAGTSSQRPSGLIMVPITVPSRIMGARPAHSPSPWNHQPLRKTRNIACPAPTKPCRPCFHLWP